MKKKGNNPRKRGGLFKKAQGLNIYMEPGWTSIVNNVKAEIEKLPDVRLDKIKKIKEAIDSGNYEINSFNIAGRILEEI